MLLLPHTLLFCGGGEVWGGGDQNMANSQENVMSVNIMGIVRDKKTEIHYLMRPIATSLPLDSLAINRICNLFRGEQYVLDYGHSRIARQHENVSAGS